jgi:hypothetical protein
MMTQNELKEYLNYNPDTGIFVWKKCYNKKLNKIGTIAGGINNKGYHRIQINNKSYSSHRLAYIYINGEIPNKLCIDHINGIKTDNRICNLRLATVKQNAFNVKKRINNKSGHKGVCWNKKEKKWYAYASRKHIGCFDIKDDAINAYKIAIEKLHGEFAKY